MFAVRTAGAADLEALAPLFDAYRQFYQQRADLALSRAFIAARLERCDSVIFLAWEGDQAIGFVQLYPVFSSTAQTPGRLWLLNDLFVAPRARSRGAGRALLEQARAHAVETGAVGLFLQTARSNQSAQQLYESLGWKRDDLFLVY